MSTRIAGTICAGCSDASGRRITVFTKRTAGILSHRWRAIHVVRAIAAVEVVEVAVRGSATSSRKARDRNVLVLEAARARSRCSSTGSSHPDVLIESPRSSPSIRQETETDEDRSGRETDDDKDTGDSSSTGEEAS